MAVEHDIVTAIEQLIVDVLPKSDAKTARPQRIIIGSMAAGVGSGITSSGTSVECVVHPAISLDVGNVAVGVPIGPNLYYIVGRM